MVLSVERSPCNHADLSSVPTNTWVGPLCTCHTITARMAGGGTNRWIPWFSWRMLVCLSRHIGMPSDLKVQRQVLSQTIRWRVININISPTNTQKRSIDAPQN